MSVYCRYFKINASELGAKYNRIANSYSLDCICTVQRSSIFVATWLQMEAVRMFCECFFFLTGKVW